MSSKFNNIPSKRSRSVSPTREHRSSRADKDNIEELKSQLQLKSKRISDLENIVAQCEKKVPNLNEILKTKLSIEANKYEEKSAKVLKILKNKDKEINELRKLVNQQAKSINSKSFN